MTGRLKKIICIMTALVLVASAFVLCCGFTLRLPRGVTVNGVDVGGLTQAEAKAELRGDVVARLKQKRLRICADERVYVFAYPEVDFIDGFEATLKNIRRGGTYSSSVHYFLNGAEEVVDGILREVDQTPQEPYAVFNASGEPFTYFDGAAGRAGDKLRLLEDISSSVNGEFEDVKVCFKTLKPTVNAQTVRDRTRKLYSFTTYFDANNTSRASNIRLAARKINGSVIEAGGVFSFNGTVGARTEANGFQQAKIIEDGKFVLGYGGGVCQVSTTIYNAALLSGLAIEEYHPHSLQVSYVSPSRDAMVSGSYFDLKFKNTRKTPVYVRVKCNLNSICCTFYGESDGYTYSYLSKVTGTIPRPDPTVVTGGEEKVISYGRDGTLSEGYLIKTKNGTETRELIRKDKYPAVADVLQTTESDEG